MVEKVRIGYAPYANMLPLFHFFEGDPRYEWVHAVPAELNRLLAEGRLDIAPISAFAYGQRWEEYVLLDDLSVSARGAVGSIFLISKSPLEQLDKATIALTSSSATSVHLLKIILHKFYGLNPNYLTMKPDLAQMMETADAALLIGDDALASLSCHGQYHFYDLGEIWRELTGHPMVFAVMAAREPVYESRRKEVEEIRRQFLRSKELSSKAVHVLIDHCLTTRGGDGQLWRQYFSRLSHGLDDDLLAGLRLYFAYAAEMNLLPSIPELRIRPLR